jgi:starvation-inducible DNA-binding protein
MTTVREDGLRQDLQAVLGFLFDLRVLGIETHAHFIGTRFAGMQRQLEAVVQTAVEATDDVGDLLRTLGGGAEGRLIITPTQLGISALRPGERCTTAAVNMISNRIASALDTIRCIRAGLQESDVAIGHVLQSINDVLDERARMLASESRSISSASLVEPG